MLQTVPRRIAAVAGAAALLILVAFYFFVWGPESKQLKAAHTQRAAAESKVTQLTGQIANLQALVKQIPADTADLAGLEQNLPDNPQLDTALNQLHAAAIASGVELTNVSPAAIQAGTAGTAKSGGPSVTMNMTASGSAAQVAAFLTQLDQMQRVVVVDTLSLSQAPNNGESASISARIFYAGKPTP